jgi:hypothetical protein
MDIFLDEVRRDEGPDLTFIKMKCASCADVNTK